MTPNKLPQITASTNTNYAPRITAIYQHQLRSSLWSAG